MHSTCPLFRILLLHGRYRQCLFISLTCHVPRVTCPELQNDWTRDGADVEYVDCFHIHRAMARSHVALASLGMAQRHLLLHRAQYQGTCEKGLLLCMIHPLTIIRLVGEEEI